MILSNNNIKLYDIFYFYELYDKFLISIQKQNIIQNIIKYNFIQAVY